MYNILTLNKISQNGLKHLPNCCYAISDACDAPDGIILRSFAMHEMELPASLLGVARAGAGVNNIPIDKCSDAGICVFNTPGANANGVKELVLAGLFLAARDVVGGVNWVQGLAGTTEVAKAVEKGKANFGGTEIMGKTIGILGLGAIGILTANACKALGMEVIGYDPSLSEDTKRKLCEGINYNATPDEIYAASDYISLHVPANAETKGMINAAVFAKCKDGVKIINFARAELVNNADIKAALESGKVSRYVTDFPNEEVLATKGIVTIPHLGASTDESEENCAEMAAKQLKDFLETGRVKNSVNFPACDCEPKGKKRITVFSKGLCPDALKAVITGAGLNILCACRGSKKGYDYDVFDVDCDCCDKVGAAAAKIEGAIRVRVI